MSGSAPFGSHTTLDTFPHMGHNHVFTLNVTISARETDTTKYDVSSDHMDLLT